MPVHERHSDPLTIEELAKLKIIEHKRGMPMPDDEALRIRTLRESFALDCSKEALIDRYLRILCRVMKVSIELKPLLSFHHMPKIFFPNFY